MAIGFVAHGVASSGSVPSTYPITWAQNLNDAIVIIFGLHGAGAAVTPTVTSSAGNTYTVFAPPGGYDAAQGNQVCIAVGLVTHAAPANTDTLTIGGLTGVTAGIAEAVGYSNVLAVDGTPSVSVGTGALNYTTINAKVLAIQAGFNGNTMTAASAPWTDRTDSTVLSNGTAIADQPVPTAGTVVHTAFNGTGAECNMLFALTPQPGDIAGSATGSFSAIGSVPSTGIASCSFSARGAAFPVLSNNVIGLWDYSAVPLAWFDDSAVQGQPISFWDEDYLVAPGGPGAISGSANCSFGGAGTLSISGNASCSFTATGVPSIGGTASCSFSATGTLTGRIAAAGTASCSFAATGTLTIAGTASCSFGASGTPTVSGSASCSFSATGVPTVSGAASCSFTATGAITGLAALSGTASCSFGATGTPALTGHASCAFGAIGGFQNFIAGDASCSFTATGMLAGAGALAGAASCSFGGSATPAIAGVASCSFAASGTAGVAFTGRATCSFTARGTLIPPAIEGSSTWGAGQGGPQYEPLKPRRRRFVRADELPPELPPIAERDPKPAKVLPSVPAARAAAPAAPLPLFISAAQQLPGFVQSAAACVPTVARAAQAIEPFSQAFAVIHEHRATAFSTLPEPDQRADASHVHQGRASSVLPGVFEQFANVHHELPRAPIVVARPVRMALDSVHAVTKEGRVVGYQWGGHGKVYRRKAQAQAQARAIYASGFKEDSPAARAGRRKVAQALRPNWHAERQYRKAVQAILAGVHRGIEQMVEREVLPAKVARQDAKDESIQDRARRVLTPRLREKVAKHVRARSAEAYDDMAKTVDKKNRGAMTLIGIPLRDAAAGVVGQVATMRENNVRLISEAGRDYVDDVLDVFTDPVNEGLRVEALRDKLFDRGNVSLSRARLIATDQTLKLSSALTKARQRAAGVTSYRWSTSQDERVRGNPGGLYPKADPSHWDLEGQEFDWSDPPNAGTDGGPAHPGEAINCRCVAIPIISDVDELEDDDEPTFGGALGAIFSGLAAGGGGLGVIAPTLGRSQVAGAPDEDEESDQGVRRRARGGIPPSMVSSRANPGAKRRR